MYKDDGERGHHMQDYIPKEELAKFLAKTGDSRLQQQVRAAAKVGTGRSVCRRPAAAAGEGGSVGCGDWAQCVETAGCSSR